MEGLAGELYPDGPIYVSAFPGHAGMQGGAAFSIPAFARYILEYMDQNQLGKVSVFGYSMGGYVGMYLARHYPDRIEKLATLGTKYAWSPEIAAREETLLDPETTALRFPGFAAQLRELHLPGDWRDVMRKTAAMLAGMGAYPPLVKDDFALVPHPVLLLLGDQDKMVGLQETLDVFNMVPDCRLGVLPGTKHPIEQVNVGLLARMVIDFFR